MRGEALPERPFLKFVKKHGVGSGRIGSFILCVFKPRSFFLEDASCCIGTFSRHAQ